MWERKSVATPLQKDARLGHARLDLQGDFFTGTPPKSFKNKIKLEYQDWYPPKSLSTRTGTPSKMSVYKETWNNRIVIQWGIEPAQHGSMPFPF